MKIKTVYIWNTPRSVENMGICDVERLKISPSKITSETILPIVAQKKLLR